jgi:hypothetical protein
VIVRRTASVLVLAAAFAGACTGLAQAEDDHFSVLLPLLSCARGNCSSYSSGSNGQDGIGQDAVAHSNGSEDGQQR